MSEPLSLTDARVVTVWERKLAREVRVRGVLFDNKNGLAGSSSANMIIMKDDLKNGAGSNIVTKLKYQLNGKGRAGDKTLKGYGEAYKTSVFRIFIDTLRHYVETESPIIQQWVTEDTLDEGADGLADWFLTRYEFGAHLHAAGIDIITENEYTLNNEIQALNSNYILRPNDKAAGSLSSNDKFTIDVLNEAVMKLKLMRPKIRPAKTPRGDRFVCFLSPEQVRDLRKSDSEWFQLMVAALKGGVVDENPLFTNALGEYNGVIFIEADLVPPGMNSGGTMFKDKTRRAWIGGASALMIAHGRGFAPPGFDLNRYRWDRETEDFGHQQQLAATTIVGLARPRYTDPRDATTKEAGVFVIETYADHKSTGSDIYEPWLTAGGTLEA
jgi:N4-gp56 family major capsid protein